MAGGIVSGPATRNRTPDVDDWGMVVRPIGIVPTMEAILQAEYDIFVSSSTIIYVGYAALGVATAAALWLIKRITFASGNPTTKQWSGPAFTAIWNNRTIIPYS